MKVIAGCLSFCSGHIFGSKKFRPVLVERRIIKIKNVLRTQLVMIINLAIINLRLMDI